MPDMKAAVAILADDRVHNFVRRRMLELNRNHGVRFYASLLPAHVSLKQPFVFDDMRKLETYFDELASGIEPIEIAFDGFYHTFWNGFGILGLNVVETARLRALHNRINAELVERFENSAAPHDGDGYHFHLTIEAGKGGAADALKRYYEHMGDHALDLRFTARKMALFFYDGEPQAGSFMTYRIADLACG